MAAVMATQAALIYQVENKTSVAHTAGIAAAAMLFVYQGAFTIGFQATVWVSDGPPYPTSELHFAPSEIPLLMHACRSIQARSSPCASARSAPRSPHLQTGS
jgi:hypothetical protein